MLPLIQDKAWQAAASDVRAVWLNTTHRQNKSCTGSIRVNSVVQLLIIFRLQMRMIQDFGNEPNRRGNQPNTGA